MLLPPLGGKLETEVFVFVVKCLHLVRRKSSRMPEFITPDSNMINLRTRPGSACSTCCHLCDGVSVCGSTLRHFAALLITASPGNSSGISQFVSGSLLSAAQRISKSIHHPRGLLLPAAGRDVVFHTEINLCTSSIALLMLFLISCSRVLCVWQPLAKSVLFFLRLFILILVFQRV